MSNEKKIILFGASKAGETYLKKTPYANIIAFTDNDPRRHGTYIKNIPVIAPEAIKALDFDTIIITSLWIDSIYHQLTQVLSISPEKIFIPQKRALKSDFPFTHEATKTLAYQLLIELNQFFIKNNISACIDSGTLLGLMRDGDLIAWDDDIDFAVDDADFDRTVSLLHNFYKSAPYKNIVRWTATVISMLEQDVCINIEFQPKNKIDLIPFETSLQRRKTNNEYSELISSAGIFFAPAKHFNQFSELNFQGQSIRVPYQPTEFLTFMYGAWDKPKKNMQLNEYDNRRNLQDIDPRAISISKRQLW